MQVGEPIQNLIDEARPLIDVSRRLESVGKILKRLGIAEISSAQSKQQDESECPEADHAVRVPGEVLPPDVPVNGEASSPRLDPRPPHDNPCHGDDDNQEREDAVDPAAGFPGEQVVVQLEELRREAEAGRVVDRRPIELVAVDEHAAGHADHEHIQANAEGAPHVKLEDRPAQPHGLRLPDPSRPIRHASPSMRPRPLSVRLPAAREHELPHVHEEVRAVHVSLRVDGHAFGQA